MPIRPFKIFDLTQKLQKLSNTPIQNQERHLFQQQAIETGAA